MNQNVEPLFIRLMLHHTARRRVPVSALGVLLVVIVVVLVFWGASRPEEVPVVPPPALDPFAALAALSLKRLHVGNISFFAWDAPVNEWLFGGGGSEHTIMHTFVRLLSPANVPRDGDVLDVGANSGVYGMVAASYGFRTYLFDLQPQCQAWQLAAAAVNRLEHLIHIVPGALGRDNDLVLQVSPLTPCVGQLRASTATTFQQHVRGIDPASFYPIRTRKLDDVYTGERIFLLKIDTEGFEAEILAGMLRLLTERRIENIILECSPVIWKEFGMVRVRVVNEIVALWDHGFTDVTFFLNSDEAGDDIVFTSRKHFRDTLMQRDFYQNDVYFHRTS